MLPFWHEGSKRQYTCLLLSKQNNQIAYFRERELVIRWDYVFELSGVNMTDKQDPSLVTDISRLYKHFLEQGYSATGMYLKCIQLLGESFMEKSLSPEERVYRAYYCKTFFVQWKKGITDTSQFISWQTFKDVCCCVDGLVMYLLLQKRSSPMLRSFHSILDPTLMNRFLRTAESTDTQEDAVI